MKSSANVAAYLLLLVASAHAACLEVGDGSYSEEWTFVGGGGGGSVDVGTGDVQQPAPPKVELFEHWKFGGIRLEPEVLDKCQDLGELKDKLTSFRLRGNCITVFKDLDCKGPSKKLTEDSENVNAVKFDNADGFVGDHVRSFKKC